MKRIILGFLDLRAQVALFIAEIHHDSAVRALHDAQVELERATGMSRYTLGQLRIAQVDAKHAAMHVRRQRQRAAVGL